jgi:hypothetical protein
LPLRRAILVLELQLQLTAVDVLQARVGGACKGRFRSW